MDAQAALVAKLAAAEAREADQRRALRRAEREVRISLSLLEHHASSRLGCPPLVTAMPPTFLHPPSHLRPPLQLESLEVRRRGEERHHALSVESLQAKLREAAGAGVKGSSDGNTGNPLLEAVDGCGAGEEDAEGFDGGRGSGATAHRPSMMGRLLGATGSAGKAKPNP